MAKILLLSGFVSVLGLALAFSCGNPASSANSRNEATILSPTDNQEYSPYNTIFMILEFDTTTWFPPLNWEFSKDQGKTWKSITEITAIGKNPTGARQSQDGRFHYDSRRWQPSLDSLETDIDLWIKASAYDGDKFVIKKNIKVRKPQ